MTDIKSPCPYRSYPNTSRGFPMLTDITGYYTAMFYSLNAAVGEYITRIWWKEHEKAKYAGMVYCVSEWS